MTRRLLILSADTEEDLSLQVESLRGEGWVPEGDMESMPLPPLEDGGPLRWRYYRLVTKVQ